MRSSGNGNQVIATGVRAVSGGLSCADGPPGLLIGGVSHQDDGRDEILRQWHPVIVTGGVRRVLHTLSSCNNISSYA